MATIARKSQRAAVSRLFTLADADDLNGTNDGTQDVVADGAERAIIMQINDGTAGTLGIDVLEVSHDGGVTWAADDTLLAIDSNDYSGTLVADGILNAAGVEPATVVGGIFKAGPWSGPTRLRIVRNASTNADSVAWTTGAPSVVCVLIGQTTGAPAAGA